MSDFQRVFAPLLKIFAPIFNALSVPVAPPQPLSPLPAFDFTTGDRFKESCVVWNRHIEEIEKGTKQVRALMARPDFKMDSSNTMLPAMRSFMDDAQHSLNGLIYITVPEVRLQAAMLVSSGEISFSEFEQRLVSVMQKQTAADTQLKSTRKTFDDLRKNAATEIRDAKEAALHQAVSGAPQGTEAPGVVVAARVTLKL